MRLLCAFLAFLSFSITAAKAESENGYRLLQLGGQIVKWGVPTMGEGATLTYALVERTTSFDDARNCRNLIPIDSLLTRSNLSRADFNTELRAAFRLWEDAANIKFSRVADPARADILIGADGDSRGWAYADVVSHRDAGQVARIRRGLVCLNGERAWKVGFGASPEAQDLRYTLAHEIGHAIGLNHPGPHGQVMSFNYAEDFANLQAGDIRGVRRLYGPPGTEAPVSNVTAAIPLDAAPAP